MEQEPAQPDRPGAGDSVERSDIPNSQAVTPVPVTPVPVTPGPVVSGPVTPGSVTPGPVDPATPNQPNPDTHVADARHERHGSSNRNITAITLIVVGAVLLAGQTFGASFDNWWALFILIPAFGALSAAWRAYQKHDGELTREVTGPGMTGIFFLIVAGVFLFDLDWSLMGGLIVILLGAGMLLRNRSSD